MTAQIGDVTVRGVAFQNNDVTMSGNVYLPRGFSDRQKYPAIVVVHPGGGVKEQVAGLYALKLAEEGFVTLAFDASHQGASGGLPRFVDDPMKRVVDFYSAVDYLTSLPYVDVERRRCPGRMRRQRYRRKGVDDRAPDQGAGDGQRGRCGGRNPERLGRQHAGIRHDPDVGSGCPAALGRSRWSCARLRPLRAQSLATPPRLVTFRKLPTTI